MHSLALSTFSGRSYSVSVFQANDILSFERFVQLTSKDARAK